MPTRKLDQTENPIANKFFQHIITEYGSKAAPQSWHTRHTNERQWEGKPDLNWESRALFLALEKAFCNDTTQTSIQVERYMIQALSSCVQMALGYDHNEMIPWDRGYPRPIWGVLAGFMMTVKKALKEHYQWCRNTLGEKGNIKVLRDGKAFYGEFPIPQWFVDWVFQEKRSGEKPPPEIALIDHQDYVFREDSLP